MRPCLRFFFPDYPKSPQFTLSKNVHFCSILMHLKVTCFGRGWGARRDNVWDAWSPFLTWPSHLAYVLGREGSSQPDTHQKVAQTKHLELVKLTPLHADASRGEFPPSRSFPHNKNIIPIQYGLSFHVKLWI